VAGQELTGSQADWRSLMKPIDTIALIGAIVGVLGASVDLIIKLIGNKELFKNPIFWAFVSVAFFAGGLYVGRNYYNIPLENMGQYMKTTNAQDRISALEKTIDFLKGKAARSSEKIGEYEKKLRIPSQGRVILFDHVAYRGHACYITLDDDVSDLTLYGFGNTVSSIKVEGDVQARVYNNLNYSGLSWIIDSDVPSLIDNDWNDKILSINVERKAKK
jgi:hypothetical protein